MQKKLHSARCPVGSIPLQARQHLREKSRNKECVLVRKKGWHLVSWRVTVFRRLRNNQVEHQTVATHREKSAYEE